MAIWKEQKETEKGYHQVFEKSISYPSNGFKERSIECSSSENNLRKASSSRYHIGKTSPWAHIRDSMKSLRPPLILWYPKPTHTPCLVHQEPNFLLQCQPLHQVPNSRINTQRRVTEPQARQARVALNITGKNRWWLA